MLISNYILINTYHEQLHQYRHNNQDYSDDNELYNDGGTSNLR